MLEMLLEEQMVHVVGVIDTVAGAPGVELARASGVPTFTTLNDALEACGTCMAFNLTGDMKVAEELAKRNHVGGIIGGVEALMMWRMVTRLQKMQNELYYLAHHDPLTGVYNRRYILDHLEQDIAAAVRYGTPYSAVLIDLDHFKCINDIHGHAAGDAALKGVVGVVQKSLRQTDIMGRWGGEEFLVLLPHINGAHAELAANKWLKQVSSSPIDLSNGQSKTITFSAGVAAFNKSWMENGAEKALNTFLECMDNRLYQAKEAGRNRVIGADMP